MLAHRVLQLALQRVREAGEPLRVLGREPDGEPVGRDRAAHAERAPRVELAHEAAADLDGLESAAERLGEGTLDEPLEAALEPLQSHHATL